MATLRTILELALRGGTETQRQLEQVGKVGAEAFKKIDEGAKKVPASLRAVDAAASTVKGSVESLAASAGPLGAAFSAIGGPAGLAAVGVLGLGAAFVGLTKKALDAGGALVDASDATGIGIESLQKYHIAAATAGVSAGEFDDAVRTMSKTIGQSEAGTGRLAKLLGTLDKGLLDNLLSATSATERFELLGNKLAHTESASQRLAIATAAGGESFAKLLPVLKDGENGFTAIGERAQEAGAIMSGELARSLDDSGDKFTELGLILEGQVNVAMAQSAPLIANIASAALDAIPSVLAFVNSFLPAQSANESLRRLEATITEKRNQLENIQGQGFSSKALEDELATLEKQQAKLRDIASADADAARARGAERIAQIKAEQAAAAEGIRAAAAARKAQSDADAAARKAASEADAARKKAIADHKAGVDAIIDLEQKAATAGLEGVAKLEAERDVAYQKFADLVEKDGLNQEEAARGYLAIWTAADKEITQTRQEEADKQADIAKKAADKAAREAEKAAAAIERQQLQLAETVGDAFGDALVDFVDNGKFQFEDLWRGFLNTGLRAIAQLAAQELILNVGVNTTGGATSGGIGGGLNLLQQGQQLLSLGSTLKSGFSLLTDALGLTTTATGLLASDVAALSASGITLVGAETGLTAGEAALLFPGGSAGAGGGANSAAFATSGGSSLAGAASSAAILFAVVAALETIGAALNVSKARDSFFSDKDAAKVAEASFDPFTLAIGNALSYAFTGQKASTLFESQQRALYGGADVKDIVYTTILNILNPLNFAIGIAGKLPTKGTALRKSFEEFLEKDGAAAGFFGANSGTFKRGIGQTGLSANDVHGAELSPAERLVLGQGARGISSTGVDFTDALNRFGDNVETFTKLSAEGSKEVTALSAVFRAFVGGKAGEESTRVPGLRADFLGSALVAGAGDADIRDAAEQGLLALGPLTRSFEKFKEFVLSGDNDIAIEDINDALQGLAIVAGSEVPEGVDKAAIALRKLNEVGLEDLTLDQITTQIQAAVTEAEALGPGIRSAFESGLNHASLDLSAFADSIFDAASEGLEKAIVEQSFQGFIDDAFKGDLLASMLAAFQDVRAKLEAKTITQGEADRLLKDAATQARDNLEQMRPLFDAAAQAGRDLASIFDDAADSADDAAAAIAKAFDQSIDRQLLGLLDPNLADQFDLEVAQRNRLKAARDAGADLADVEKLNGLERAALAKQQAQDTTDQIARIYEQARVAAERAIQGVKDLVTQLTATTASPLPPEEALANAQATFASLAAKARGGDLAAIEALPAAGQAVIELAQSLFGSTDQFFALFNPTLATLKEIAGLDPSSVKLSAGDQAIVSAIKESSAEALALYQQMLDALTLDKSGREIATGGATPGDQVSVGIVGGTAGQFGLSEGESRQLQQVLASAVPGGQIEKDLVAMLGHDAFDGTYGPLLQSIFEGATSAHGRHAVLEALLAKVRTPATFQPVLGFDTGGSFRVRDSIPLIRGRVNVSAGETVTVTTHGMDQKLGELVREAAQTNTELRALRREYAAVLGELGQLRQIYQHAQMRPAVPA